jgi:ABC-type multidrug transport system fused ATPase/permease subunit
MKQESTPSIPQLLPRLWAHVSVRRRVQLSLLFLLMMTAAAAELVSIGAVLPFLGVLTSPDIVFGHPLARPLIQLLELTEPRQLLIPLTILFGMAAVASGGFRLLLSWAQTRLSYAMGADFSIEIYRRTLYQPYAVHMTRNTSEVIAGVTTKADGIVYQTLVPVLVITSSGVMMITVLLALLAVQPAITAAAIGSFGTIYAVVIVATRRRLANDSQLVSRQQTRVIKALQEALGGIRDVLIDGTQNVYCKIYRDADWRFRRSQSNIAIIANSPRFIVESLGMALIAALAYVLAARPGGLGSAIPVIGALALAAQRMLPLLQQSYASWSIIRGGQAGLSDALDFLDQALPDHADAPLPDPLPFQSEITFDRVGFRYAENQPRVFNGLNLKIAKHSCVGFIGTTGSGKSTLLDITMGLLSPSEGELKVDGQAITAENYRAWQAHIAHVPQSIFLADVSVAENIAFGVPLDQIDFERVRRAAESAQIASTIESWIDQYDTVVGERGVRLSGGQRQRIGIARALYKDADVIVFDEATSALDGATEHAVMESINNLSNDLTILIVAHRLTTLRDCTQVVELADGVVKRVGTYREIIESDKSK